MIFHLEIRSAALADINRAAEWYEAQRPGLGLEFARALFGAVETMALNPFVHRIRNARGNIRWLIPARFPYRVVYKVRGSRITVVAVLHCSRDHRHLTFESQT